MEASGKEIVIIDSQHNVNNQHYATVSHIRLKVIIGYFSGRTSG